MSDEFHMFDRNTVLGSSIENRMLRKLGGAGTTAKMYRTNPDGSVTMVHTRYGSNPEVVLVKKANGVIPTPNVPKWGFPWHGVFSASAGGSMVMKSFADGSEQPLRGYNPNATPDAAYDYNAVITTPEGALAQRIPPPTGATADQSWVNYACISKGVLFGAWVGYSPWLCVRGGVCYVVTNYRIDTTLILEIYTLDEWVAGMDVEYADNFVLYDQPEKTPFMVAEPPSGRARVMYQTIVVELPAYDKPINYAEQRLRIKRSDVCQDGGKIIFAYEVSGLVTGGTSINNSPVYASTNRLTSEAMWVELSIASTGAGVLSATTSVLASVVTDLPGTTTTVAPPTFTEAGTESYILGYMYAPDRTAKPVVHEWVQDVSYSATTVPVYPPFYNDGYDEASSGYERVTTRLVFDGKWVALTFASTWAYAYNTHASPGYRDLQIGDLTVEFCENPVYSGRVGTGPHPAPKNWTTVYVVPVSAYTDTNLYANTHAGLRREINNLDYANFFGTGYVAFKPSDTKYGLRTWFATNKLHYGSRQFPKWPSDDTDITTESSVIGTNQDTLLCTRDAYNAYGVYIERTPDSSDSHLGLPEYLNGATYANPLVPMAHLTPYGWILPNTTPPHNSAVGGWSYSFGELEILVQEAAVTFDINGRCSTDAVVKYAKDEDTPTNQRCCM